jgi:predicted GNAT family acetyltransferase
VAVCGVNRDPYADLAAQSHARSSLPARLRHLYVKASHRRHGVGRRLFAHACRGAAAHFRRIQLRTHSTEAILFYERLGFVRERGSETVTHTRTLPGSNTELLLIRHAESQPTANLAEPDWPLTERGSAQAWTETGPRWLR